MKKLLLVLVAVLLITGTVQAASIPGAVDPKNHREIWTTAVYNNSGVALTSGTVVVWDFASSTGDYTDQCNWVTLSSSSANHIWTAGIVISDSIAIGSEGSICIRGVVPAKIKEALTVDDIVGTSGTYDGFVAEAANDGGTNNDYSYLGIAVNAEDIYTGAIAENEYIYVNPTLSYDNE